MSRVKHRRRHRRPAPADARTPVIWAVDRSPAAIAAAFAERDASVRWGPCGPIGTLPMVMIPDVSTNLEVTH